MDLRFTPNHLHLCPRDYQSPPHTYKKHKQSLPVYYISVLKRESNVVLD